MDFMAHFTMGTLTGGHYITMLPADAGQYPHQMTLCPPVAIVKRCFGIRLLLWRKSFYALIFKNIPYSILYRRTTMVVMCTRT